MPDTDYRALWEDAARNALIWRDRFEKDEELLDGIAGAVHDLRSLWEPRKRGYAQARDKCLRDIEIVLERWFVGDRED